MMRLLSTILLVGLMLAFACAPKPDVITHGEGGIEVTTEVTNTDAGQKDTQSQDQFVAKTCKHDCDCVGAGVCQAGKCDATIKRASFCLSCDSQCKAGEPCLKKDGSVGKCETVKPPSCKNDCDCTITKYGGVCDGTVCNNTIKRKNNCLSCSSPACQPNVACLKKDNTIGKCPTGPPSCKNDCDCVTGNYGVCESGICNRVVARGSLCAECGSPNCKPGSPCMNNDQTIGTCGTKTACKDDCDCSIKGIGVCHQGYCAPLKRATICPPCSQGCTAPARCITNKTIYECTEGTTCQTDCDCAARHPGTVCSASTGTCTFKLNRPSKCQKCDSCQSGLPCLKKDRTVGTCSPCKHDCDCVSLGLLCDSGVCRPLRRLSQCLSCDGNCKKGDPCREKTGAIGVCAAPPTTFACGGKTCQSGKEYCSSIVGGAPPPRSCTAARAYAKCPSYCNDLGLTCNDGKRRCTCPSFSCNAFPPSCTTCNCLKVCGSCQEKQGHIFVTCYAP